ncbi:MAG: hypothetical protein ACREFX_15690, partial [Opitutaceae bacterium]
EELRGAKPGDMALRLRQMEECGIAAAVSDAVEQELLQGGAELAPWGERPPTDRLLALSELLRSQMAALRR